MTLFTPFQCGSIVSTSLMTTPISCATSKDTNTAPAYTRGHTHTLSVQPYTSLTCMCFPFLFPSLALPLVTRTNSRGSLESQWLSTISWLINAFNWECCSLIVGSGSSGGRVVYWGVWFPGGWVWPRRTAGLNILTVSVSTSHSVSWWSCEPACVCVWAGNSTHYTHYTHTHVMMVYLQCWRGYWIWSHYSCTVQRWFLMTQHFPPAPVGYSAAWVPYRVYNNNKSLCVIW